MAPTPETAGKATTKAEELPQSSQIKDKTESPAAKHVPNIMSSMKPRDAFAAIMSPHNKVAKVTKSKHASHSGKSSPSPSKSKSTTTPTSTTKSHHTPFNNSQAFGPYLTNPLTTIPPAQLIFHDDNFIAIHDRWPKASVHTLLLPRNPEFNLLHPIDALGNPDFLALVKVGTARLKRIVASQLQRQFGPFSAQDVAREAVLNGDDEGREEPPEDNTPAHCELSLPAGREWEAEVKVGIHLDPSMDHVHVHVMSRDMHAKGMKNRKHYNSFTTPFLVDVDDFPLAGDDERRSSRTEHYLKGDMHCWRCGMGFGNQFVKLKRHLEEEFEAWKRE